MQLYECGEEDALPELETARVDMKLGTIQHANYIYMHTIYHIIVA